MVKWHPASASLMISKRKGDAHHGSVASTLDRESTSEKGNTFPHTDEAQRTRRFDFRPGDSATVVLYVELDPAIATAYPRDYAAGARMAGDVRQDLLEAAEKTGRLVSGDRHVAIEALHHDI